MHDAVSTYFLDGAVRGHDTVATLMVVYMYPFPDSPQS